MAGDRKLPDLQTRLRLNTDDLDKAERKARRFTDGLGKLKPNFDTRSLDAFAAKADKIGASMTRAVTLPIVAAGAASSKMAFGFEQTFTEMVALADVATSEVEGLKEEVKDLARETGRSPDDLAKALYFIRSSGFEGATALDILTQSAQGARVGLGDAAVIADLTTSAMNAYGAANLSAADTVGYLIGAVREGKGEPEEMANELGGLLPVAQKLGVGFDQVSGALAFLTLTSGNTAESSTRLSGIFQKMLAPSRLGAKELERVGLSAETIRKSLRERGLIATLQMLDEALQGNIESYKKVFEDSRAIEGVFSLLRDGGAPASKSIDNVTNSVDALGGAVESVAGSDTDKIARSWADLQVTMIEVGQQLLPLIADIGDSVAGVVGVFTSLPGPLQTAVLGLVGTAAALGPVAKGGSLAATGIRKLMDAAKADTLSGLLTKLRGVSAVMGTAGIAAAGAGAMLYAWADNAQIAADRAQLLADRVGQIRNEADLAGVSLEEAFSRTVLLDFATKGADGLANMGVSVTELNDAVMGTDDEWKAFVNDATSGMGKLEKAATVGVLGGLRESLVVARRETEANKSASEELGIAKEKEADATAAAAAALADYIDLSDDATESMEEQAAAARSLFDAHQRVTSTAQRLADAQADLAEAQRGASGFSDEMARALEAVADAEADVADAQADSRKAQAGLSKARDEARKKLVDLTQAARESVIAEKEARLELDDARRALQEGNFSSSIERRKAELRAEAAEVALLGAGQERAEAQAAAERAKDIEGSDEVRSAIDRITEAAEREQEARERLGDASREVAKVQADAARKVTEAQRKVEEATLDHVFAQAELTEATDGTAASTEQLITELLGVALSLDPSSPLRRNLAGYIEDLLELRELSESQPAFAPSTGQIFGGSTSPAFPSASGPGRSADLGGIGNLTGAGRIQAPTVAAPLPSGVGGAVGSTTTVDVSVPIQVIGNPDSAQLAQLEETVERSVTRAMQRIPFR